MRTARLVSFTGIAVIATAMLLAAPRGASAQLSGFTGSTSGSSCSGNDADGFCGFARQTLVNSGSQVQSRYAWNINADIGVFSTRDSSGSASHNVSFNAAAVGGYRLDIATARLGDINRINDASGCDGSADTTGITGSSNVALSSGTLSLGDPGGMGAGGDDNSIGINQNSNAIINRVSNGVSQSHSMTFTWSGSVRSNSCEAAVRMGVQNGSTTDCGACGYAGSPGRDQNSDGHFVTVNFTSLCGNGAVNAEVGEQCDLGGANGSSTSCCTSTCTFRSAGQTCRVGAGAPCDVSETCSGSAATCPTDDAPGKAGTTCRIGSGDTCDPDETCTGVPGQACPANVVRSSSFLCRSGSGDVCDPAENCTGIAGQTCPANVVNGPSQVCRPGSGDSCDAQETCSGVPGATCPPDDAPLNAGTVCRSGSGDSCDANETCTGSPGATCPPDDAPGNAGVVCRPSSVHGAFCDDNELCTGTPGATCPPNDAPAKLNVVCRAGSGDMCDPDERCSGLANQGCPADVVASPVTVCRTGSGDMCDPNETCTAIPGQPCPADTIASAGTQCRASSGQCDVAEQCSGSAGQACPANGFVGAGTACDNDSNVCSIDECNGSGSCLNTSPLDCDDGNVCTQDTCDPILGCQISGAPSNSCQPALKGKLQVKDSATNNNGDRLKFDWKGGPVLLGSLGNPLTTTRYELCVYDNSGIEGALDVAPGSGWAYIGSATAPKGYKFKDKFASQDGVNAITLKASSLNKAKLKLTAKADALPDGILPLESNVTAQLYADGQCWEMQFGPAETKRSDAAVFSGKTPAN